MVVALLPVPSYRRLGGPQSRPGGRGEEKNPINWSYRELNPGRSARSLVTILTELPRLITPNMCFILSKPSRSVDSTLATCFWFSVLISSIISEAKRAIQSQKFEKHFSMQWWENDIILNLRKLLPLSLGDYETKLESISGPITTVKREHGLSFSFTKSCSNYLLASLI
jgi:hypothetical protein